jgi:hypothetical protein
MNIRRQRRLSQPVEYFFENAAKNKADDTSAKVGDRKYFAAHFVAEPHRRAGAELTAWFDERLPRVFGQTVEKDDFDFAAGVGLGADEAGGDDPRVVEDECVAGTR